MNRRDEPSHVPPEEQIMLRDEASGLRGLIVLHSTALGPAAGGCRLWHYDSDVAAADDAVRLAEGMSYKNALAGLPLGGGKSVIQIPRGSFDRAELFRAFGRAVEALGGRYLTAEDVGTTVPDMQCVAQATRHVAGLPAQSGAPGGDPSPWTALGVFRAMQVAVAHRLNTDLSGLTVGVLGVGNVGFALCQLLHDAGARLIIAEARTEVGVRAAEAFGAELVSSAALVRGKLDVFAPCALGGAINARVAEAIKAKVICGGANNQLATPEEGERIAARGILYAPDYLVNAGGIINVAAEYLGWSQEDVAGRVERIGQRLSEVLEIAAGADLTPEQAAGRLARSIMAGGGTQRASLAA